MPPTRPTSTPDITFAPLDDLIGSFRPAELILIGGRPAMGKIGSGNEHCGGGGTPWRSDGRVLNATQQVSVVSKNGVLRLRYRIQKRAKREAF